MVLGDSVDGFRLRRTSPAEQRAKYDRERAETAQRWFDGNEERADDLLDALPYSSIPAWYDVDRVMEALAAAGLLKHEGEAP